MSLSGNNREIIRIMPNYKPIARCNFFPNEVSVIDRYVEKVNWLKLKTVTFGI